MVAATARKTYPLRPSPRGWRPTSRPCAPFPAGLAHYVRSDNPPARRAHNLPSRHSYTRNHGSSCCLLRMRRARTARRARRPRGHAVSPALVFPPAPPFPARQLAASPSRGGAPIPSGTRQGEKPIQGETARLLFRSINAALRVAAAPPPLNQPHCARPQSWGQRVGRAGNGSRGSTRGQPLRQVAASRRGSPPKRVARRVLSLRKAPQPAALLLRQAVGICIGAMCLKDFIHRRARLRCDSRRTARPPPGLR